MIASEVIEAGVKWVLSLFNPAGAFVKACMMIYEVVQFFMERGGQIMSLVNAVIDSVTSIASGDIGGAAAAIENALASSIPVAISFLGSLLGLGDIPSRVQDIIESIRSTVDNAINAIMQSAPVQAVAGFIKNAIDKLKNAVGMGEDGRNSGAVQSGIADINAEEQKYLNKEGQIKQDEAQEVAKTVQSKHSAFQSITVVDGGNTWDYEYVVQRAKLEGEPQEEADSEEMRTKSRAVIENVKGLIRTDKRLRSLFGYRVPLIMNDWTENFNAGEGEDAELYQLILEDAEELLSEIQAWLEKNPKKEEENANAEETPAEPEFRQPKPNISGKEGAKDIPEWAKGERPYVDESGNQYSHRLLTAKYGEGAYPTGPGSEFNKLKKYGDRNFD